MSEVGPADGTGVVVVEMLISADGPPSAEDLDRSDALRAAIADLPGGQRRAVALHYYAGLPAGQIAGQPGAARVSLHKARA